MHLSAAGAQLLDDLIGAVDQEIRRAASEAIARHVATLHRKPPTPPAPRRRLHAEATIPPQIAVAIAERLDTEPDASLADLALEFGYPLALVECAIADLHGQHVRLCRALANP